MKVIHVARKPLSGTVAENVLEHGAGALHIKATRISYEDGGSAASNPLLRKNRGLRMMSGADTAPSAYALKREEGTINVNAEGRWPANLILEHLAGCRRDGNRRVKGSAPQGRKGDWQGHGGSIGNTGLQAHAVAVSRTDADGMETVDAWVCEPGCPVAALDEQSGDRPSGGSPTPHSLKVGIYEDGLKQRILNPYNDTGGASRFFKQVGGEE
jgi:hypothetical protein